MRMPARTCSVIIMEMSESHKATMRLGDPTLFDRSIETLSAHFHYWGRIEAPPMDSPLYSELGYGVALDPEILAIAACTGPNQPAPNNLFAAVQYLLLRGADHPLRAHYPHLSGRERPMTPAFPAFRDFCLSHREELETLVATRRTQTNAVRRSAALRPAFVEISRREDHPLALVEVGTSAGLNLLWDDYRIEYRMHSGEHRICGPEDATVRLHADADGPLPTVEADVAIASRVGIDTHPIDIDDEDALCWLHALIFPEHIERHAWLDGAVALARRKRPRRVQADATSVLRDEIARCPSDAVPVVFATLVLYQFAQPALETFLDRIEEASIERPLWMISMEPDGTGRCDLMAIRFASGTRDVHRLAVAHPHGWSLQWLSPDHPREEAQRAFRIWKKRHRS